VDHRVRHPQRVSRLRASAAQAFFAKAGPALEAHAAGRRSEAIAIFSSAVSGFDRVQCRAMLEERVGRTIC